jgi:hypothetical protein
MMELLYYNNFRIPEGICFAGFTCTWLHFARFHLWGARRRQHNLKNLSNNTVQQDAKI